MDEIRLCPCGCGRQPKLKKHVYAAHGCCIRHTAQQRKAAAKPLPLCPCGCGKTVKPNYKWATSGCPNRGKPRSPEAIAKQIVTRAKNWTPEKHEARAELSRNLHRNPEFKAKHRTSLLAYHADPTSVSQVARLDALRKAVQSPNARARKSTIFKALWQDPAFRTKTLTNLRQAFKDPKLSELRKKLTTAMWKDSGFRYKVGLSLSNRNKPSALHVKVKQGLLKTGIQTKTHVPIGPYVADELNEEFRVIIEINGCFWHACPVCQSNGPRGFSPRKAVRRNLYLKNQGWTLIEIWEHEWKQDPSLCLKRISDIWVSLQPRRSG